MVEDMNLNSTEGIPGEFIDEANKTYKTLKRDQDGKGVKDSSGNYVYEIDSEEVKSAIKNFYMFFSNRGVDLNQVDFDDYRIEGISLEKIPKKALTVIQLDTGTYYGPMSKFYVFDKRSNSGLNNPLWQAGTGRMYSNHKGRYVDVGKIPGYQFLDSAKNIWVIPEEVLTRDTLEVKRNRSISKTGMIDRYKKLPYDGYRYQDNRILDKSGYVIDPDKIKKKLEKFKKDKALNSYGSYVKMSENIIMSLVDRYNLMAKTLLKLANSQLEKGRLSVDLRVLSEVNKDLNYAIDLLRSSAENADNGRTSSFEYRLETLNRFDKTSSWLELEKQYKEALSEIDINSATEGLGCKYNRTLQATDNYFIDSNILLELEGDL